MKERIHRGGEKLAVDYDLEEGSGGLEEDGGGGGYASLPEVGGAQPSRSGAGVDHVGDRVDEGKAACVEVTDVVHGQAGFGDTEIEESMDAMTEGLTEYLGVGMT